MDYSTSNILQKAPEEEEEEKGGHRWSSNYLGQEEEEEDEEEEEEEEEKEEEEEEKDWKEESFDKLAVNSHGPQMRELIGNSDEAASIKTQNSQTLMYFQWHVTVYVLVIVNSCK